MNLATAIGWAVLHSVWEGTAIALIAAVVLCFLRSSAARYLAGCVALILVLVSFAATLLYLMPSAVSITAPVQRVQTLAPAPGFAVFQGAFREASGTTLPLWIAVFWSAGVVFFQFRALGGLLTVWRLRRTGVCAVSAQWQQCLNALCTRLLITQPVLLLQSSLAEVPVAMGHLRPVILMPISLLAGMSTEQIEMILLHELAHIRRHDYLMNLLQSFAEGLLFYHPAIWWISRIVRTERENCCDDLVVATTKDAYRYALVLTALAQTATADYQVAPAATGGDLVKRIRRLLNRPDTTRSAVAPLMTAGLAILVCGAVLTANQFKPEAPPRKPAAVADAVRPAAGNTNPAPKILAQVRPESVALPPAKTDWRKWLNEDVTRILQEQEQSKFRGMLAQARTNGAPLPGANSPWSKWVTEDVAYIITDQERQAFGLLASDQEREAFVEQFWSRRDPTPGTPQNEYKEAHYRRIAHTNERFSTASGLPGWKTDRGRIYIVYGPPDELESHPSGGSYTRPAEQGGGTTSVYPFEQWRYKFIQGVGNDVHIDFVDSTMTGEYRMTMDPRGKEAGK